MLLCLEGTFQVMVISMFFLNEGEFVEIILVWKGKDGCLGRLVASTVSDILYLTSREF